MHSRHHHPSATRSRRMFAGVAVIVASVLLYNGAVAVGTMIDTAMKRAQTTHVAQTAADAALR